jgi:hypothetical protein
MYWIFRWKTYPYIECAIVKEYAVRLFGICHIFMAVLMYFKHWLLKENSSQLNNCYNSIHCSFLFVNCIPKEEEERAQCWEESDTLFIQLTWSVSVTSHEEVSWPLTLRQEIPNIHISNVVNTVVLSRAFRGHWSMCWQG